MDGVSKVNWYTTTNLNLWLFFGSEWQLENKGVMSVLDLAVAN